MLPLSIVKATRETASTLINNKNKQSMLAYIKENLKEL